MRYLESTPDRYDVGMRWLTLGRVDRLQASVAAAATESRGARVLEIGCGTGSVTAMLVARGGRVTAVDQNPEMLDRARDRLADAPEGAVTWLERTASEIDQLPEESFDAVVASLCLSEMSARERSYVLRQVAHLLRPGGVFAVADEVSPRRILHRTLHALLRVPQAALAWLVAGSTSRPIADLAAEIRAGGFCVVREERWLLGSLAAVIAEQPS